MKKLILLILVLQLFILACDKEKIQNQQFQETASTNLNSQKEEIEKLRDDLKFGLIGTDNKYQENREQYKELIELGYDEKQAFETVYCDFILEKWANETAKSSMSEYNFDDIVRYALNLGVTDEALNGYRENDKIQYWYDLVDKIRYNQKEVKNTSVSTSNFKEEKYEGKVILPKTSWKSVQKIRVLYALPEYDIDNNGVKDLLSVETINLNEVPFSMAMNGSKDMKDFFKVEKLRKDGYDIDLDTLTENTVIDLIDYDGDNIPELVVSFQDENYNSCVYLFVYDIKNKIYKESFNMRTMDYFSVEKYGYSSSMGNGSGAIELYWLYKNGKFLEIDYEKVKDL